MASNFTVPILDYLGLSHNVQRDSQTTTQVIRISWQQIGDLLAECFPEPNPRGRGWTMLVPHSFPGSDWLWLNNVRIEPFQSDSNPCTLDSNGLPSYTNGAQVTLEYIIPQANFIRLSTGQQYIGTRKQTIGGQFMKMPWHGFFWEDDEHRSPIQNEDVRVGKFIPTIEHTVSCLYVLNPPFRAIADRIGCVNSEASADFTKSLIPGIETAELLFIGCDGERKPMFNGKSAWNLTFKFSQQTIKDGVNRYGWNHFYRTRRALPCTTEGPLTYDPETDEYSFPDVPHIVDPGWVRILSCFNLKPIYPPADFSKLFDSDDDYVPYVSTEE